MYVLIRKEIRSFFYNITGYLVLIVFLIISNLFMWVFPGNLNIIDYGYSTLDTLFTIAPWVFLFLVPAITMRMFSEEKEKGTLDLLYTRPITDLQIIFAKYSAALSLVVLSILPTFLSYYSVYKLGNPAGNLDVGGTWGSYIGLVLLGAAYASIGIFASSISKNQIVSFLIGVFICFIFYLGFDYLAALFGGFEVFVSNLGINEHYISISRGVVDSRDILYYLSIIVIFNFATKLVLQSRKW